MTGTESIERIAMLLSALGSDVAEPVLADLPESTEQRVRKLLDEFSSEPLSEWELDEVLEEFLRFLRFAADGGDVAGEAADGMTNEQGLCVSGEEPGRQGQDAAPVHKMPATFTPSDDPFADLHRLQPFQIAGALKAENPRSIALVLNCLPPSQAGAALQLLPAELQREVFMLLKTSPTAPRSMLERIVATTVRKGCRLDLDAVADPEEEVNRKMAELLRAMGQQERTQILQALEEKDAEAVEQIKKLLYVFDDLLRITDRTVQKILSEVDSATLATALKDVDSAILEKVMGNLSKRARVTLKEEIEFLGVVKPNEQETARQSICDIMSRLDASGDLDME